MTTPDASPPGACPTCHKPTAVCVCDRCAPVPVRRRVVVLQHPQEQDRVLGTVPLLEAIVGAKRVVGLSWPNLAAVAGEGAGRWAVVWPSQLPKEVAPVEPSPPVRAMDRHGVKVKLDHEGYILLDGSWSQGKALWWRNAWLLRLDRVVLSPANPSIYGRLRKEPRPSYVSTLEAAADVLVASGEDEAVRGALHRAMRTLVQRARDAGRAQD
jgi:DTW domain-containing protein YfiP